MNIIVRNNVDYTPLMWVWIAVCLLAALTLYVEVKYSTRRAALKRVRPLIEKLLLSEKSDLTVSGYVKAVENRFRDPFVWLRINTIDDLAPLYMIQDKKVELAL